MAVEWHDVGTHYRISFDVRPDASRFIVVRRPNTYERLVDGLDRTGFSPLGVIAHLMRGNRHTVDPLVAKGLIDRSNGVIYDDARAPREVEQELIARWRQMADRELLRSAGVQQETERNG